MCGGGTIGSRVGMETLLAGWLVGWLRPVPGGRARGSGKTHQTRHQFAMAGHQNRSLVHHFRKPETGNRKPETGNRKPSRRISPLPGLDAFEDYAHDLAIQCTLEHVVLDARVDGGIIVDFDDPDLAVGFLEVDAVQAIADQT